MEEINLKELLKSAMEEEKEIEGIKFFSCKEEN